MQVLRPTLQRCITDVGFNPSPLFNAAGQSPGEEKNRKDMSKDMDARLSLWFAAQKYPGTLEEARIWKSVPQVRHATWLAKCLKGAMQGLSAVGQT